MTRFVADQNKVVLIHESGTYATISGNGTWVGQVTEHAIEDAENYLINRHLGTSSRSYSRIENGPRDVTGTLTYHPQDMRLPFWAIGSVQDIAGTPNSHVASQVSTSVQQNPFISGTGMALDVPISFTIEDSKQSPGTGKNFVRTINGCVPNTVTITATQGEKLVNEVGYIGQNLKYTSGTTTSVTEVTGRPYLWSDCTLTVNGSTLNTAKEVSLEINNNVEGPHYLNGSRVIGPPFLGNREIMLNVTLDLDSNDATMLYETFYKNAGSFNAVWDLNADSTAGSQHSIFIMSGCRITAMENPSTNEGLTESTVEINVQNVAGSSWDNILYNPF